MTSGVLLLFAVTLIAQAALPQRRLPIVLSGAALSLAAVAVRTPEKVGAIVSEVPWGVLLLLGSLGVVSEALGRSAIFTVLAVLAARWIEASPGRLVLVGALAMFVVSGLVNNLTALLLVLPVVLTILQLGGTSRRHLRWTIGTLLVACNLGGAATPIGDFPAVLLLGAGAMGFVDYLRLALPIAVVALGLLLVVVMTIVRPARDLPQSRLRRRIAVAVIDGLHARVRVRSRWLVPAAISLLAMLTVWTFVPSEKFDPALVAWLGAAAVVLSLGRDGVDVVRKGVDLEASLFLFALLVMVGAVRESGTFSEIALALSSSDWSPHSQLSLFVVVAAVATGLFSAGPSMAALLQVAPVLTEAVEPSAVYIGLAFGVCAGSSLLLTAATSGPLAQSLVERAQITDEDGEVLSFGFVDFLPVGILSFGVIVAMAVVGGQWLAIR